MQSSQAQRIRNKSTPVNWKIFVAFFFILPFIHYTSLAIKTNRSVFNVFIVFSEINPVMSFIILMPFVIGGAFYTNKRWAWILLTEYSVLLLCFTLFATIYHNDLYNITELLLFAVLFAFILLLNRENVKVAYQKDFMSIPRGWRNARRYKLKLPVEIFSNSYITEDISLTGLSICDPFQNIPLNSEIKVTVNFPEEVLEVTTGLARKTETISGFAFRNLSAEEKRRIKKIIYQEKKRQYTVTLKFY
jgi:hypothetical protein